MAEVPPNKQLASDSPGPMHTAPISSDPLYDDWGWDDHYDSDVELDEYCVGHDFFTVSSDENSDTKSTNTESLDSSSLHSMDIPSDFSDDDIAASSTTFPDISAAEPLIPPASKVVYRDTSPDAAEPHQLLPPPAPSSVNSDIESGVTFTIASPDAEPHRLQAPPPNLDHQSFVSGYKLVFDNINMFIKPRYMRSDSQNKSLDFVQVYSVQDRIDFSPLLSHRSAEVNLYDTILPTSDDYVSLKNDFAVLVSRMITTHLVFFSKDFKGFVQQHIPHRYSSEMCKKSEVVR